MRWVTLALLGAVISLARRRLKFNLASSLAERPCIAVRVAPARRPISFCHEQQLLSQVVNTGSGLAAITDWEPLLTDQGSNIGQLTPTPALSGFAPFDF